MKLAVAATVLIATVFAISLVPPSAQSEAGPSATPTATPCPPRIDSVTPTEGQTGTVVTLIGSCFEAPTWIRQDDYVRGGWDPEANGTSLTFAVITNVGGGINISVETSVGRSNAVPFEVYKYWLRPERDICVRGVIHVRVADITDIAQVASAHGDTADGKSYPDSTDAFYVREWRIIVPSGTETAKVLEYAADPIVEFAHPDGLWCDSTPAPVSTVVPSVPVLPATLPDTGGPP